MTNTITIPRSVVEQALDALQDADTIMEHRQDIELRRSAMTALRAALEQPQVGEVVVTTNQQGHCVAVTRQDDEGKILSVIWQVKQSQSE